MVKNSNINKEEMYTFLESDISGYAKNINGVSQYTFSKLMSKNCEINKFLQEVSNMSGGYMEKNNNDKIKEKEEIKGKEEKEEKKEYEILSLDPSDCTMKKVKIDYDPDFPPVIMDRAWITDNEYVMLETDKTPEELDRELLEILREDVKNQPEEKRQAFIDHLHKLGYMV